MRVNTQIKLIAKEELKNDVLKFTCLAPEIAKITMPGQFIELRVSKTFEPFLRRPISIYNVDKENNTIEFIVQTKGRGTKFLSQTEVGEELDVVGPLGNGTFDIKDCKNIAIIGGGIGIFPLYELAKNSLSQANVNIYLGFRNKQYVMLEEEFTNVSTKLTITTDDGTYGKSGYAIDYLKSDFDDLQIDGIFACGPLPMLQKVKEFAESKNVYCQLSLEQRMACAIGACMGCSVKLNLGNSNIEYARVCKDGPVFDAEAVDI